MPVSLTHSASIPRSQPLAGLAAGPATLDAIAAVDLSLVMLPLAEPISDAKVLTGRQKPLTEVAILFAEITSREGHEGVGFSYSKRAGGRGMFAHAQEVVDALLGEDPNDIARLWDKLIWAGASVGRSGMAAQALAAFDNALWDMKAKRAGLPMAKLLGARRDAVPTYNTSGGFLSTPTELLLENCTRSVEAGIGGIKIKVGQPDPMIDLERLEAVRNHLGPNVPLMVDANQQWDRPTAQRVGRVLEPLNLVWIEEPLDAYDVEGHAMLAAQLDTPIASGEMLTSVAEHVELIRHGSVDFIQPDAGRVGGITQFLKIAGAAEQKYLKLAPHFAMEIHVHLAAAYAHEAWVEHFDWLDPLFNEKLEIAEGQMIVPPRPGLGFTISEQARRWAVTSHSAGSRS